MLKLKGNLQIDIEFDGWTQTLNQYTFREFIIHEQSWLIIPIFQLTLFQFDYSLLKYVSKTNLKLKVKVGTNSDDMETYELVITNFTYKKQKQGLLLTLTGLLDVKDFTNIPKQQSFKDMNSNQVLQQLEHIKPIIKYEGDDKQTWIRPNTSEKQFAEKTLLHSYTGEDDLILYALNIQKELIAINLKKAYKEPPKIKFFHTKNEDSPSEIDVIYQDVTLESDNSLYHYFLSEKRQQPILTYNRELNFEEFDVKSLKNETKINEYEENLFLPVFFDGGNTHENYFKAYKNHLNYSTLFQRFNIYILLSKRYLNTKDLTLLDTVKLKFNDKQFNELADDMSGKYIVTEKISKFTIDGFTQRIKVNRDYLLNE